MALIKCAECGHKVSSMSRTCPNCGYRVYSVCGNCRYYGAVNDAYLGCELRDIEVSEGTSACLSFDKPEELWRYF